MMPEPIETLETGQQPDPFAEMAKRLDGIQRDIQTVNQRTSWLPSPQQQAPQETNFFVDPRKAASEVAQQAVNPAFALAAQNAVYIAQEQARRDKGVTQVFEHYGPEVEAKMSTWNPAARLNPQNWIDAATIVKDKHLADLAKLNSKPADNFLEGRAATGGGASTNAAEFTEMTPEMATVARNMGEPIDIKAFGERRTKILEHQRRQGMVA